MVLANHDDPAANVARNSATSVECLGSNAHANSGMSADCLTEQLRLWIGTLDVVFFSQPMLLMLSLLPFQPLPQRLRQQLQIGLRLRRRLNLFRQRLLRQLLQVASSTTKSVQREMLAAIG